MKKKKFISLLLVAALAVSMLAACGSSSSSSSSDDAEETTAETSGEAEAESTGDGATFKIGGIGPTTGAAAVYGQATKNGAQMAVDEINAAGGINGYQIEFQFEDDTHDAETAVNAYNTLKDWGMQLLIGTVTSNPCIAVAQETYADNMYQLTPSGSSAECVAYDNAFRVCFSDPNQGTEAAKYIASSGLATKIAVIYDSSDSYSSGIYQNFATEAEAQGLEIVSAEAFTSDSNTDFSVQLQKAKDGGAELIFLPIYYTEASLILSQADSMEFDVLFYGCDGLDGILSVENFDTSLAEGLYLQTPFSTEAEDEAVQTFVTNYEATYGETPNQFAADGYDAVYIIKTAIEEAGITPDMSVSDICDAMEEAMVTITFTGATGTDITWSADGEPNKDPMVVQIVDGVYAVVE